MNLKNKIFLIVVFVVVVLFAVWFFSGGIECVALEVKREDAVKGVTVTGNVRSIEDVEVTTEVTGVIEKILVSTGDYVKKGHVLARLDREEVIGEVEAAKARFEAAQVRLKKDEVDYEDAVSDEKRYKKLLEIGAVSKRQLEERTLRKERLEEQLVEDARQIEASRGELTAASGRLENYIIKAPVSGIITEKFVSTGDIASPQQPLFRLVSPKDIYLSTEVEEDELDSVQTGQKALVIFDAYPERVFEENVFLISRQVNPLTGTFEARITKPDEKEVKVLVGMTLDATIVQEKFENVMVIPFDFVTEDNNKTYVFKKVNYFAKKTEIKTLIFDNNRVLVEEGLKEGDIILKRIGTGKLKDNTKIKIREFREQ